MKPFIGIKKIWYGDVITSAVTKTSLKTWLGTATEVENSHQDTWGYTEDDPNYTDYINELNGSIYYRDVTQKGAKTIAFTMGVFSFDDKVDLQGGEKVDTDAGWAASDTPGIINKAIVGQTKTGNYIVFTNAAVIAKGNVVEKNIGLGVTAVAMENPSAGVKSDYMFDGEKVDAAWTDEKVVLASSGSLPLNSYSTRSRRVNAGTAVNYERPGQEDTSQSAETLSIL